MPRLLPNRAVAALLACLLGACSQAPAARDELPHPPLGLFTSLPIYWGEGDIADLLDGEQKPSWVRGALEERFALRPLDALEPETLAGIERLVLAQPRPLAPSENVALDDWVRAGGRLLLFADPMLTRPSTYALGDKRRPQDIVLLSPILRRWGLELRFDERQAAGLRWVGAEGEDALPVNLAGSFALVESDAPSDCTLSRGGLIARCRIGRGEVTLVADAALLDGGEAVPLRQSDALDSLVAQSLAF